MSVGRICTRVIATALPHESVRLGAQRMAEYDVGTTVILSEDRRNRAVGIVTDRDIAVRCVAKAVKLDDTKRLVVTGEEDRVVGILSLDDVLDLLSEETGAIRELLEKQKPRALA